MNRSYRENIDEVVKKINSVKKDIIIIGDNSSGKSDILKKILQNSKGYYYIDSYNRTFNYKNISDNSHVINEKDIQDILEGRLKDENFNLRDSFGYNVFIEKFYKNFKKELKEMLNEFLGIDFEIELIEDSLLGYQWILKINNEEYEKLSSGYQAIIRIFLELIFSTYHENKINCVIIDEINEFLSARNEKKILPYLKEKFQDLRFIVTTHSEDVISSGHDCELIVLRKDNYELLDGNDYRSITDVRGIFTKLYFEKNDEEIISSFESILRKLYNQKIMEQWDEIAENELNMIPEDKLSNTEKVLLKNIREW